MLIDHTRDYEVRYSPWGMNVDRGERAFLEIVSREEEERANVECK